MQESRSPEHADGGVDIEERRDDERLPSMLIEEKVCAGLLALMVLLMFCQAAMRNCAPLGRTVLSAWLAHATEVLPSGLTWLTFLACSAVTRRNELLRINILRQRLPPRARLAVELSLWALWALFFAVLFVLGSVATYGQRRQMTSLTWLPAWAVALSIPVGAALVIWRTLQNMLDLYRSWTRHC